MHYYQFNVADWCFHTSHLTLVEEAVYHRLINHYYDTEKPIPEITQGVYRRLRLDKEEGVAEIANAILKEFFVLGDEGWVHKRCREEILQYQANAERSRENGKKGGRPRLEAVTAKKKT